MTILAILVLAIISGVCGRLGGAQGFDTKYRDVGCSLIVVVAFCILFGFDFHFTWVYLLVFGLHWAAFSTYWDKIFKYDNLWFSGAMVGVALFPIMFIDIALWWVVIARSIVLCVVWGCLNKYLPQRVLFWRRDVFEELARYTVSL
jgi:hypothetical protein